MKKYTHKSLIWLFLFHNLLQGSSNSNLQTTPSSEKSIEIETSNKSALTLPRFMCCCFFMKKNRIEDHKEAFKKHALQRQESMPKKWYNLFYTPKKRISNKTESQNKARISAKKTEQLAMQAEFELSEKTGINRSKSSDLRLFQDGNCSQKSKNRSCNYHSSKNI